MHNSTNIVQNSNFRSRFISIGFSSCISRPICLLVSYYSTSERLFAHQNTPCKNMQLFYNVHFPLKLGNLPLSRPPSFIWLYLPGREGRACNWLKHELISRRFLTILCKKHKLICRGQWLLQKLLLLPKSETHFILRFIPK